MPQTNYFLWFVAFASALGGFLFGYEIGIINTILSMDEFQIFFGTGKFNQNGQVVATEQRKDTDGNIVAIFTIGCVFGSAAVSYLAGKLTPNLEFVYRLRQRLTSTCCQIKSAEKGRLFWVLPYLPSAELFKLQRTRLASFMAAVLFLVWRLEFCPRLSLCTFLRLLQQKFVDA